MDAKILEIMQKGPRRAIARVEVDDAGKKITIPVALKEGMDDDAFKAAATAIAEKRLAALAAVEAAPEGMGIGAPVVSTPEEIPAAIEAVKAHFLAKIGEVINLK